MIFGVTQKYELRVSFKVFSELFLLNVCLFTFEKLTYLIDVAFTTCVITQLVKLDFPFPLPLFLLLASIFTTSSTNSVLSNPSNLNLFEIKTLDLETNEQNLSHHKPLLGYLLGLQLLVYVPTYHGFTTFLIATTGFSTHGFQYFSLPINQHNATSESVQ